MDGVSRCVGVFLCNQLISGWIHSYKIRYFILGRPRTKNTKDKMPQQFIKVDQPLVGENQLENHPLTLYVRACVYKFFVNKKTFSVYKINEQNVIFRLISLLKIHENGICFEMICWWNSLAALPFVPEFMCNQSI